MSEFKLEVSQDEGNGSHVFYVQCGIPLDKTTLQVAGLLLDGGYNPGEIEPLAEVAAAYVSVTEVQEASTVLHTTGRTPRELAERVEQLEAALREASHWIRDGSGMSPAKRGANLETVTELVRLIDSLLARNGTE